MVLSPVQSNNDPHRVGSRQEAVTASGLRVATFAALGAGPSALLRAGLVEEEATPEQVRESAVVDGRTTSGDDRGTGR